MKYCIKCGNELRDEAVMCPKCGGEVENVPQSEPQQKKTKFCTYCGAEVLEAAIVCPKCGCPVAMVGQNKAIKNDLGKSSENNGLQLVAKIFLCISCVIPIIVVLFLGIISVSTVNLYLDSITNVYLGGVFLVYAMIALLPFFWVLPMTSHYFKMTAEKRRVGIAFKICTLLFVNLIAGICMLCDKDN